METVDGDVVGELHVDAGSAAAVLEGDVVLAVGTSIRPEDDRLRVGAVVARAEVEERVAAAGADVGPRLELDQVAGPDIRDRRARRCRVVATRSGAVSRRAHVKRAERCPARVRVVAVEALRLTEEVPASYDRRRAVPEPGPAPQL